MEGAIELGKLLVRKNVGLVFGGARVGLMGAIADVVENSGGEVIGVIPLSLVEKDVAHKSLKDLRIVETMHERKSQMADLADAFIAMPGGFGTLDEFCEMLTWAQLGFHKKPCGLLNIEGYYDLFLEFIDHAIKEKFMHPEHRSMVLTATEPSELIDLLENFTPVRSSKWLNK